MTKTVNRTEIKKSFEALAKAEQAYAIRRKVAFFFAENELDLGYTIHKNNISVSCIFNDYDYLSCWYALKTEKGYVKFDIRGIENFPLAEYYLLQRKYTHVKLLRFVHLFLLQNPKQLSRIKVVETWTEIATKYLALLDSNIDTDKKPEKAPENVTFSWKNSFRVKYEITKIRFNGEVHEVRNGFIIYND